MCVRACVQHWLARAERVASASLPPQCTCDHSDILFESIRQLSGGSARAVASGESEGFDPAELGVARSADNQLHASTSGPDEREQAFIVAALEFWSCPTQTDQQS